jgi:hypothetical protein
VGSLLHVDLAHPLLVVVTVSVFDTIETFEFLQ